MTDLEIYRGLTGIFRDIFDDSKLELRAESSAAEIPEWSSFNHISIIVATEEKFEVRFSVSDTEKLKNVGDFVALIQAKRAKKA